MHKSVFPLSELHNVWLVGYSTFAIAVMLCYNDFRCASLRRHKRSTYLYHIENAENHFPAACASTEIAWNPINYIKPLCVHMYMTRCSFNHTLHDEATTVKPWIKTVEWKTSPKISTKPKRNYFATIPNVCRNRSVRCLLPLENVDWIDFRVN